MKKNLPNATTVLVLGILSIITSLCYGVIGLILGIVALVLAKKDRALYSQNPEEWLNYDQLNNGRTCAIIGVCLSGLMLLATAVYFAFVLSIIGAAASDSGFSF